VVENRTERLYVQAADAREFVARVLVAEGLSAGHAGTVAECLVRADLRGVDTHGIGRLPGYVDRLRRGLINPRPKLAVSRVSVAAASLDGDDGFGFVVGRRAMDEAIEIAAGAGIGIVSARRSTHFGMAAAYALMGIEHGLVTLVVTNASPGLAPWGGREPLVGTSPLAFAAPAGTSLPFVLDMSPTVVARGKIRKSAQLGQRIPKGWALDAMGRDTTDPTAALEGVLLPIGAHKGSGLSIMMDILGGVLSGAGYAGSVGNQYLDYDRPQNVGHFFLVMRPDLFVSIDEYRARIDHLIARIHGCEPAEGFSEVLVPGEIEAREEAGRAVTGIPFFPEQLDAIQRMAREVGMGPLRAVACHGGDGRGPATV
jgi:LDH2 family malate/lactate/ureidoglycolate dehydrogenase